MAKKTKGTWPSNGFADFSQGESRLASERSTVESIIRNGIDDKLSNDQAREDAHNSGLAYMLNATKYAKSGMSAVASGSIDNETAQLILTEARRLITIGTAYYYGATVNFTDENPSQSDCSGTTQYVFKRKASIDLPRVASQQGTIGKLIKEGSITVDELKTLPKPADLIFYKDTNKKKAAGTISHVGICVGEGTGKMIHASSTKNKIDEVEISSWYMEHFYSIRRILPETVTVATSTTSPASGDIPSEWQYTFSSYDEMKNYWMPWIRRFQQEVLGGSSNATVQGVKDDQTLANDVAWIMAIESHGNHKAANSSDHRGLFQFSSTWGSVEQRHDPVWSIKRVWEWYRDAGYKKANPWWQHWQQWHLKQAGADRLPPGCSQSARGDSSGQAYW